MNAFPVLTNQILKPIHRFSFGNIKLHRRLADVEIYFPGRAADVTEIRVGHLSGTVDVIRLVTNRY